MENANLVQLAQDKINEETKARQLNQIKCRLERIASLEKSVSALKEEITKIEVAPLEEACYSGSTMTYITTCSSN